MDGAADQTYVNLVYGNGTLTEGVCNSGDHKVAGPQPRPAPANKIVFTGVGDWADPNGRRTPRATLFRVDIEDRSEPGGSHPGGSVNPPDRYRIRIWVVSEHGRSVLQRSAALAWRLQVGMERMAEALGVGRLVDLRGDIPASCPGRQPTSSSPKNSILHPSGMALIGLAAAKS